MIRKGPLIWLAFSSFFILYVLYNIWTAIDVAKGSAKEYENQQTIHLINYLKLGNTLLKVGMEADLKERLEEARETRYIDFFILQRGDRVVYFGNKGNFLDGINLRFERFNELQYFRDVVFASTKVDDLTLTVGINLPKERFWRKYFENIIGQFTQDITVIAALAFFVLTYFLKDLIAILKALGASRDFSKIKTRSRESEMLAKGLSAYEGEVQRLEEQNTAFGNQVLPSLKAEILSGRTPPYEFNCTLVRTDINGFSKRFNESSRVEFLNQVNAFFLEVSHIVSRYQGFIHEFVGDEVIFYFKDDDHQNSVAAAAGAVKDIHSSVGEFGFTVKSSLAHGCLRFGRQVNGFSLAGSILIETVRIQSHIADRSHNTLFMDESCAKRIEYLCDLKFESAADLKGIGMRKIWSYVAHKPLQKWLAAKADMDQIQYYRADEELAAVISAMASASVNNEQFQAMANLLKPIIVTRSTPVIKTSLLRLIDQLEQSGEAAKLATAVTLCGNLISPEQIGSDVRNSLQRLAALKSDSRVASNALETLAKLGESALMEIPTGSEPRVMANALVRAGLSDLSENTVAGVRRLLNSSDESEIASALYAVGELARHHRQRDPIGYVTRRSFLELVERVKDFESHQNESVRRQAHLAAKKVA